jgi:Family of unknown function (DUF5519)
MRAGAPGTVSSAATSARTPRHAPGTGRNSGARLVPLAVIATTDINLGKQIAAAVMALPRVERAPHRFGGVGFRLGKRELGHLHGDALVDRLFPRKVRDVLGAAGRAAPSCAPPLGLGELLDRVAGRRRARSRSYASPKSARSRPSPGRSGMSAFSEAELAYLQDERRLDPIATVGPDGRPHVGPVGMWRFNLELDTRRRALRLGYLLRQRGRPSRFRKCRPSRCCGDRTHTVVRPDPGVRNERLHQGCNPTFRRPFLDDP